MKTIPTLSVALALGLGAAIALAQDAPQPRPRGERPPRQQPPPGDREGGRPGPGIRPMLPPLMAALDANRDGVIDSQEIANASNALKTLDKNGDGQITQEELRPPRRGPDGPGAPDAQPGPRPRRPRPPADGDQP